MTDDSEQHHSSTLPAIPSRFERRALARPGRPSKLVAEIVDKFLDAIEEGQTYKSASACAGIAYQTVRNWVSTALDDIERGEVTEYVTFLDLLSRAEASAEARAVRAWTSHFDKDYRAARDFLERRHPEMWGRRDRVDINAKVVQGVVMLPSLDTSKTDNPFSGKVIDADVEVVDDVEDA